MAMLHVKSPNGTDYNMILNTNEYLSIWEPDDSYDNGIFYVLPSGFVIIGYHWIKVNKKYTFPISMHFRGCGVTMITSGSSTPATSTNKYCMVYNYYNSTTDLDEGLYVIPSNGSTSDHCSVIVVGYAV